jgi:hypothetical protein
MRLFTPYRTTYRPARSDTSRADPCPRRRRLAELDRPGQRLRRSSKPTHTSLVPLCVWGQARTKRADRGGSTAAWRALRGGMAGRREGDEQGAHGGSRRGGAGPPLAGCPLPGTAGPRGRHSRRSAVHARPLPWSRSRRAGGPDPPSWPAPDLLSHSSTMWWQTVAAVETGGTADQPALASLPSAFSPCTR